MENRTDPSGSRPTRETDIGTTQSSEELRQKAAETAEQVKQAAKEQIETVKRSGKEQLESGKSVAADQTEQLADAVGRVGHELDQGGQQTLASYAGNFAAALGSFSEKLRHSSVDELASEAQELARRNPGLFIAGSVGIGFALARFLKASTANARPDHEGEYRGAPDRDDDDHPGEGEQTHFGETALRDSADAEGTLQSREYASVTSAGANPQDQTYPQSQR